MAKKNNTTMFVFLIMAVVLVTVILLPKGTQDNDFLELQFYDKDGNKIFDTSTFATVTYAGSEYNNVASIGFAINVENTGNTPITIDYVGVSPTQFSTALPQNSVTLQNAGDEYTWQSTLMDTNQFVPGSQNFQVSLRGTYTSQGVQQILNKEASVSLEFTEDPVTGDFTVTVGTTAGDDSPSMYCGDGTCDAGEDYTSCPSDCSAPSYVIFRTNELDYFGNGAWIMYNGVGYGYEAAYNNGDLCADQSELQLPALLNGLPGDILSGVGVDNIGLYQDTGDVDEVWACQDRAGGDGSTMRRYDSGDADALNAILSTAPVTGYEDKEVYQ